MTHLLSLALYGKSLATSDWPRVEKTRFGISDLPVFENHLSRGFSYTNSQYDQQEYPNALFLDILNAAPELIVTADIVTCSDVLEHVPPPVQRAFHCLFSLLKPGGTLIFTCRMASRRRWNTFRSCMIGTCRTAMERTCW
jgi:SAM-dependent methyltransferase